MKKEQLMNKLEESWAGLIESYSGLSEAQCIKPGVTGNWSVKDILAHVSAWEGESLKHLPGILRGERTPRYSVLYGGIDAFNAQVFERKLGLALSDIQRELDETHRKLIEYVQSAPEEPLATETRFRRRLRLDTYSHYPIHAQAIRDWRERGS